VLCGGKIGSLRGGRRAGKYCSPRLEMRCPANKKRAHSLQGNIKYSPLVILVCGIGRGANFLIEQRLREDVIILETSDFVCPAARARSPTESLFSCFAADAPALH